MKSTIQEKFTKFVIDHQAINCVAVDDRDESIISEINFLVQKHDIIKDLGSSSSSSSEERDWGSSSSSSCDEIDSTPSTSTEVLDGLVSELNTPFFAQGASMKRISPELFENVTATGIQDISLQDYQTTVSEVGQSVRDAVNILHKPAEGFIQQSVESFEAAIAAGNLAGDFLEECSDSIAAVRQFNCEASQMGEQVQRDLEAVDKSIAVLRESAWSPWKYPILCIGAFLGATGVYYW